ncbi:MAG TPA: polysaccharide biosynthesis C-terminal domain-containing protein [Candidatus Limnocylindria bacterium]
MTERPTFSSQVARIYAARILQFGCTVAVAFFLARLLGPAGRGQYSLLLLLPSTLFALGQLGLPSALTFFAGGGRSVASLTTAAAGAGATLALVLVVASLVALPALQPVFFASAPLRLLQVATLALPIQLATSFFGSILWGRQLVRPYIRVLAGQSLGWLLAVIVLVGVAGFDVAGALAAYLLVTGLAAAAVVVLVLRERARTVADRESAPAPVRIGALLGYGLRLYPAGVTTFLSYRADLFLLSALRGDAAAIGLYALAVSLAEITFQVPDSVATLFYPRVAGSEREEADRLAPSIARFTLLVTVLATLLLIPLAWLAVRVVLPGFDGSLLPFLLLLPGTVALGLSKVLSGYISGLGRPEPVGLIAMAALGVNLVVNLLLIPPLGIIGAALASMISYSSHALMTIGLASRLSGARPLAFVTPGREELRILVDRLSSLRPRSA